MSLFNVLMSLDEWVELTGVMRRVASESTSTETEQLLRYLDNKVLTLKKKQIDPESETIN